MLTGVDLRNWTSLHYETVMWSTHPILLKLEPFDPLPKIITLNQVFKEVYM